MASFLGVVVFWHTGSTLWHSVLDFIHLTQSHVGMYLAEKVLECLDWFGLHHYVVSVCLDNASNNDVIVQQLVSTLPNFPGAGFHGHCVAHIMNLAAKAFMEVFSSPLPKKHMVAANTQVLTNKLTEQDNIDSPLPNDLNIALEVPGELPNEGMKQHDTIEVQKAVGTVIEGMVALYGLHLSESKLKEA
ncbi:hypothetical protein OPQ81_001106 [Rhizoctonia solani]|nr:hypothetical protein OPQ81_001106 [Rhizoctonia solani]